MTMPTTHTHGAEYHIAVASGVVTALELDVWDSEELAVSWAKV